MSRSRITHGRVALRKGAKEDEALTVAAQPDLAGPGCPDLADLHQVEDNLARDVAADPVDVEVPAARHPTAVAASVKNNILILVLIIIHDAKKQRKARDLQMMIEGGGYHMSMSLM